MKPAFMNCTRGSGVAVVVEDIQRREVAHGEHEAVLVHGAGHLVEVAVDLLFAAALVPGLAQEDALAVEVGFWLAVRVGSPLVKAALPCRSEKGTP
jgi:hypothetical protein